MNILSVRNACFSYSPHENVFKDVNLSIDEGEVFTILGPNGAGKSTLLSCLTGLNKLTDGEITLCGKNIDSLTRREIAQKIGFVPQVLGSVFSYSVLEYVVMGRAPHISSIQKPSKEDYRIAYDAIDAMGITHLAQRNYAQLSGGERQQVAIARIIVQDPQLIILDEPTSALDFGNQVKVIRMVRDLSERGYSIIMTTHNPDHAIMLDGIIGVLDRNGTMKVGEISDIITEDYLSEVYQLAVKISYVDKVNRSTCLAML